MSQIILHDRPDLKRPILVVAFAGWSDAGRASTLAQQQLVSSLSATKIGEIDPEDFFDFTSDRPWVRLGPDGQSQLTWPVNSLFAHRAPAGGLDTMLLLGTEPGLRWRTFTRVIVDLVREFDVSLVVTLGAHPAQISHHDAVPVSGWAWPGELSDKLSVLGVNPIAYEGPAGIVTALTGALAEAQIPVASLWAGVPMFLGATPNPKAAHALLKRLDDAADLGLKLDDLADASEQFERNVDRAIRRAKAMPGVSVFQSVEGELSTGADESDQLDRPADSVPDSGELPTADEAIRDAEDFLRSIRGK